jgi:hypothetical protein
MLVSPAHSLSSLSVHSSFPLFTLDLTTTLTPHYLPPTVRVQVKRRKEERKERRKKEWVGGRMEKA